MQLKINPNGYAFVWICGQRHRVHRLVALTFLGPKPKGATMCRHLNDDPRDNRLVNLAWGTMKDNVADAFKNKGYWRKNSKGSHDPELRECVEHLIRQGYTYPSIHKLTGVCLRVIFRIREERCPEIRHATGSGKKGRKYA